MKSRNSSLTKTTSVSLLESAFLALPMLALTPNFFIIPDLTYQGLATQEVVFAIAATFFALVGMIKIAWRRASTLTLDRGSLLIFVALAVFILWQLITLAWTPAAYEGLRLSGIWLGFGVLFVTGVVCLRPRSAEWLHYVMTAVTAILAISIIYERRAFGEYMLGIFFSHGITAELLVTMLPLQILNYLCSEKRWLVVGSFLVSALSFVALLIGLRRGAILGTLMTLAAIGLALGLKKIRIQSRQRLVIVVVLITATSGVLGVVYRENILYRIRGATQLDATEGGLRTRLRGWITAWEMGKRNALAGVGNAGYPNLYGSYRRYFASNPNYADIARYAGGEDYDEIRTPLAHNEYLQVFVELGIIGLALLTAFLSLVIKRLWRGRLWRGQGDYWVLGSLLGLIAFGISSFFSAFSFRYTPAAFIVACLLGIGFAFARRNDGTDQEQSGKQFVSFSKTVATAAVAIPLAALVLFVGRTYNVYASQLLQGRTSTNVRPLDFAFYPENPAGNEALERRYKAVLELDSENSGAHLGLGLLLFQSKKPAEAIPYIEFALKHGYSRPFGYVLLAFAQEQKGDLASASRTLADCVASFPQSLFARAAYGEILRKEGKTDDFRENQEAMYQINKNEALSWEVALRMKVTEAMAEATGRGLIPPDKLQPRFASALVGARAFHYLK